MRRVRLALALATAIGAESTDRLGEKCISPSHAMSRPQASATSTRWKPSSKAPAWLASRISNSMKIPKSIALPPQRPEGAATLAPARGQVKAGPGASGPLDGEFLWVDSRPIGGLVIASGKARRA
jgi:hypothetical protein